MYIYALYCKVIAKTIQNSQLQLYLYVYVNSILLYFIEIWLQIVRTITGATWSTLLQKEVSATQFSHLILQMSSIYSIPHLKMKPAWDIWILVSRGMTILLLIFFLSTYYRLQQVKTELHVFIVLLNKGNIMIWLP